MISKLRRQVENITPDNKLSPQNQKVKD